MRVPCAWPTACAIATHTHAAALNPVSHHAHASIRVHIQSSLRYIPIVVDHEPVHGLLVLLVQQVRSIADHVAVAALNGRDGLLEHRRVVLIVLD